MEMIAPLEESNYPLPPGSRDLHLKSFRLELDLHGVPEIQILDSNDVEALGSIMNLILPKPSA